MAVEKNRSGWLNAQPILNIRNPTFRGPGGSRFLNCPRCGSTVSGPPEREWTFQQYHVSRFKCDKGDRFNLYKGDHKTFTIPRMPIVRSACSSCKTENPDYAVYCKNCGSKL